MGGHVKLRSFEIGLPNFNWNSNSQEKGVPVPICEEPGALGCRAPGKWVLQLPFIS